MGKKNSYLTVTDQFCGAGGSAQGVKKVAQKYNGGLEVKLALNHWSLAIETHNTNFPDTVHDCTDVSACDPRRYPSTDILITSPECTNHSNAQGTKKAQQQLAMFDNGIIDDSAERSRATMWDVVRFAEVHNYNIIITENVVDARKWVMFESWVHAMRALGYEHKCCFLNSMHFWPTPQSRDRMYVVFWKKGNKAPDLNYMPLANCQDCGKDVNAIQSWKRNQKAYKYRSGYVYCCPNCSAIVEPYYYSAFNCIDWSQPGELIGARKKPLADKTLRRIEYGLKKYGTKPFLFPTTYSDQARGIVKDVLQPARTQTTFGTDALLTHPYIITSEHSMQEPNSYVKSAFGAMATQTTRQTMGVVTPIIAPIIVNNKGKSTASSSLDSMCTQTTVINNGILSKEPFNSFLSYYYGGGFQASHISEAADTFSTVIGTALTNTHEGAKLEDCYYRTLKAHEVKIGMAFDKDYIILGNARDQVKQCGNAVTPPVMEWLVERVVESLN